MALTAAQLRNRVLEQLGIVGAGQIASGEDAELVDEVVAQTFDDLVDSFPFLSSSVPDWAAPYVRDIVSARAAGFFGHPPLGFDELEARGRYVAARDRRIPVSQEAVSVEYY